MNGQVRRTRHDKWLGRGRALARRPRALLLRAGIFLLLFLLVPAAISYGLLLPPPSHSAPGESPTIRLPQDIKDTIEGALAKPTSAEILRIRQLEFIADPFIMPPPMQARPMTALDGDSGARAHFDDFRRSYAASRCADGGPVDETSRQSAKEALQEMDLRLSGLAQARLRYHQGLIDLCEDDFSAAEESFAAARAALGDSGGEAAARQYRAVARVGAWLAARKKDRAAARKKDRPSPGPLGKLDMTEFSGELCGRGRATDCDVFDNRSSHLLRAMLSGLLAGSELDPDTYRHVRDGLRTNVAALGPKTVANLAAASAIYEDADHIGTLVRGARRQLSAPRAESGSPWVNSVAAARLVNLAWMTGRIASDDRGPSQWFPGGGDLPVSLGFEPQEAGRLNSDIEKMGTWKELAIDRSLLLNADFEQFIARANASSDALSEDRKFLAEVRGEMLKDTAPTLSAYTDTLALEPGGDAARGALLRLLRTKSFPVMTRLDAASKDRFFGLSFQQLGLLYLFFALLALTIVAVLGSLLAGYARAFPRRHFDNRLAQDRSATKTPPVTAT